MKLILLKKQLLQFVFLSSFLFSHAQVNKYSLEKANSIKSCKLLVGTIGCEDFDDNLMSAITEFWNFTEVAGQVPVEEGIKKTKNNKEFVLLKMRKLKSDSVTNRFGELKYKYIRKGFQFDICSGRKRLFSFTVSPGDDFIFSKEELYYAISAMNDALSFMFEKKLTKKKELTAAMRERSPMLQHKILLISEECLDNGMHKEDVDSIYGAPVAIVSHEEWKDAIINRKPDTAYLIINPMTSKYNFMYLHVIMDAESGIIYGIANFKESGKLRVISSYLNGPTVEKAMLKKYAELYTPR